MNLLLLLSSYKEKNIKLGNSYGVIIIIGLENLKNIEDKNLSFSSFY